MDTSHEHGQTFQCRVTSEAVTKHKTIPEIVYEDDEDDEDVGTSELDTFQPKHKILIQRVFQQTSKGVVEQKLDYIVATSDEEITKHVFGGLFKNRYYPYQPENYCKKHDANLFEHKDEALLKIGDKFDSLETFRLYIDSYAKQWKYYLKCADSHRRISTFVYRCVFGGPPRAQYFNPQGLRKRTPKLPKGTCPCRVIIKPVPEHAETLTVVYVCNHHDHPLTDENFEKLQHGRRIHPSVKEELMDLLSLDVDREVVKKYFESMTGFVMDSTYFSNMLMWMKKNNIERQFTLEKLKEMSKKIGKIKEQLGLADDNNCEDEAVENDFTVPDKASQIQEAINMLRSVASGKKPPPKPKIPRNPNTGKKRTKIIKEEYDEDPSTASPVVNRSRLEARLQELTYDHETLQSIKHLQDSVRGEPDDWSAQQEVEPWNRSTRKKPNRQTIKIAQKHYNEEPELEPQTVVIENTQNFDGFAENQEIICENEITVMDTPAENYNEIVVYENPDETNGTEIVDTDNEVKYCIKYEDVDIDEQTEDQYVLLENLENVPEVHIQATKLATVSIVSPKEEAKEATEVNQDEKTEDTIEEDTTPNETDSTFANSDKIQFIKVDSGNIKIIGEADATLGLNEDVLYEVVNTNDKKLYPSREVVRKVILNKPSSKISKKSSEELDEACYSSRHNGRSKSRKPKLDDLDSLVKTFVKEEDLETLNDDEYYMVVVNNDELDATAQTEDTSFMNDDCNRYTIEAINEDRYSCTSEELILDENIYSKKVHCVNKKIQCNFLRAADIKTEIKKIKRLKRMRQSLEQDVKRLVETKDGLVKDIMKAKRMRRPRPVERYVY